MHIPDGLMDPKIALLGWVEFLFVIAGAMWFARKSVKDKDLPRVALLCAGIFVAQMVNFPVGGGTTGHLIGGTLFAVLVGPATAIVGMTVVILIQALMFGDGGITSFGLNALNMAVIAPLMGWGTYTLIAQMVGNERGESKWIALATGAWASVFVASAACAAELSVSYAVSGGSYGIGATISVPAILGYHAVIGIGEALITVGVMAYLSHVAPDAFILTRKVARGKGSWTDFLHRPTARAALAILLVFALALPLYLIYASDGRDGLEQTMATAGTGSDQPFLEAPFSYGEGFFAMFFAGVLGFLLVALLAIGVMRLLGMGRQWIERT